MIRITINYIFHVSASELLFLHSVKTGKGMQKLIRNLQQQRKATKIPGRTRKALSAVYRKIVFDKTAGCCHLCGAKISANKFQADHVMQLCYDGANDISNYLPSCVVCNHLRWYYSPEELQLIIRLVRWM